MSNNLLNQEQIKHLGTLNWEVCPAGAYIDLYPTDFENNTIWEDICVQCDVPYESEKITILYIGVKTSDD